MSPGYATSNFDLTAAAYRPWSPAAQSFAEFYRRWLAPRGLTHGPESRSRLVQSHPALFGRTGELALQGYQRWLEREHLPDTIEAFARYVEPRYRRWLAGSRRPRAADGAPS